MSWMVLERNGSAEARVLGLVYDTHAAAAEPADDPVVGDRLADHGARGQAPCLILSSSRVRHSPIRAA
jgi:hypothetical protein